MKLKKSRKSKIDTIFQKWWKQRYFSSQSFSLIFIHFLMKLDQDDKLNLLMNTFHYKIHFYSKSFLYFGGNESNFDNTRTS